MSINVTVAQMRVVATVARTRSFGRAAEQLHVAQSSVSRTVAEAERSVSATLFDRSTRHVELTTEGRVFVDMAEDVLARYDEGLAHFAGYLEGSAGVLRVAALPSLAATLLPEVVSRFRRRSPEVRFELEDVLASEVADLVRGGSVDLAVTAAPPASSAPRSFGGMPFETVAADDFRCLVHPEHPWADRTSVRWHELASEAFVCFDAASSVRTIVDATLARCGVEPQRRITARNIATVAGLSAAGLGVTAVPAFVLPMMQFAELVSLPLEGPTVRRHVGVLTDPRRRGSRAAAVLLEVLRDMAAEGAPLPAGASWVTPSPTASVVEERTH